MRPIFLKGVRCSMLGDSLLMLNEHLCFLMQWSTNRRIIPSLNTLSIFTKHFDSFLYQKWSKIMPQKCRIGELHRKWKIAKDSQIRLLANKQIFSCTIISASNSIFYVSRTLLDWISSKLYCSILRIFANVVLWKI